MEYHRLEESSSMPKRKVLNNHNYHHHHHHHNSNNGNYSSHDQEAHDHDHEQDEHNHHFNFPPQTWHDVRAILHHPNFHYLIIGLVILE
jgi:hypothetical protein